jgi:hypothetical protein
MSRLRYGLRLDRVGTAAYVTSFVVGMAALSLMGRLAASEDPFVGFVRFHHYLNPETFFYPTASQVIAIARESAPPDQILVIIGGSSIMYGAGQGSAEVWTDTLQADLGDRFKVVNLALPAGAPAEHGAIAAEALLKEGRRVVHVTQIYPTGNLRPMSGMYPYVIWDARAKGLLLPSDDRDASLANPSPPGTPPESERTELRMRSALDSVLYFTDLWNTVAYKDAFTLWYPLVPGNATFASPRSQMKDMAPPIIDPALRYNPIVLTQSQQAVTGELNAACVQNGDGGWDLRDDTFFWSSYLAWLNVELPAVLRDRTLNVVIPRSPYYWTHLPEAGQQCLRAHYRRVEERLRSLGLYAELVGEDWTDADYLDSVHPSGPGGEKMAHELAPMIRTIAASRYGNER